MARRAAKSKESLEEKAEEVASLLSAMANSRRLIVMCSLISGERSVGDLAAIAGLSDAALSQHLARLRLQGLVQTRRDGQTIYYSLASEKVREVLSTLYRIYCT